MVIGGKNIYLLLFLIGFGLLVLPSSIFAINKTYEQAATPDEVVVIYNNSYTNDSDSNGVQDSLQVANYYRDARLIPNQNVIGISATTTEAISRSVYNTEIKTPIESALTSAGIASSTKYIVLVKGVPLKIKDSNPATGDFGDINSSDYSSVDSALCLLFQNQHTPSVLANPYYNDPGTSKDYRFKNGFYGNSTVRLNYLVTRLDGYSLIDVINMIDNSVLAYTSSTKHFILDDHNKDYDSFSLTYSKLKAISGVTVNPDPWSDTTSFITTSTEAVIGYASHGFHAGMPQNYYSSTLSLLNWSPGAVSVTYESYNALSLINPAINNGHGQLASFIAQGGSGGIGNVYEPYASAIAKENIWAPAYALGYNWADAAYMSMAYLDWVNVVLGDPLMVISDNVGPEVNNVTLEINSDNKIKIDWVNPGGDFSSAYVVRSTSAYPKNVSEGTTVCSGNINSCVDNSASLFTTYYYTVFAVDVNGNYGRGLSTRATGVINKNSVSFSSNSGLVAEGSGVVNIRASFASAVSGNKSLKIILAGSAVKDQDYTISSTTQTVLNGQSYHDIAFNILDNYIDNNNKVITISLESDDYWAPITHQTYSLTIEDNDTFGVTTQVLNAVLDEGQVATRTILLTSQPTHNVTFDFSTSTKYTLSTSTLVVTPLNWNSTSTYTLLANNDYIVNGGSTTTLNIVTSSVDPNYNNLSFSYSVIVSDVDVIGLEVDPVDLSLTEGNSKPLKVRLKTKPNDPVSVNLSYGAGLSVDASVLIFNSLDWSTQKTVNVFAVDNSARDGSRNVNLNLVASTTDVGYLNISKTMAVSISDDEPSSGGSSGSSGGGGGGGGSSTPQPSIALPAKILAVNQNLVLESGQQAGSVNKSFFDNSWVKLSVSENTVNSKTTFNVNGLEVFQVDLPVISRDGVVETLAPINNMVIEVVAKNIANENISKFSKDLSLEFHLPQMAKDDRNLSLYYFNESEKKWILINNAVFDLQSKKVYFTVDHLTKFAVFRNIDKEKVLATSITENKVVADVPEKVVEQPIVINKTINKPSPLPAAKVDRNFSIKNKGKIFIQVEGKGEAWYVDPKSLKRNYMANGDEAFKIMRKFGVGITNANLNRFKKNKHLAKKQAGTIFIQVEAKGEAWYVGFDGNLHYLKNGLEAYNIMRKLGVGIKNRDLAKIEENK